MNFTGWLQIQNLQYDSKVTEIVSFQLGMLYWILMEAIRLKNSCLFKSCVGILCLNHSVMIMSLVCIVVF